MIAAEMTSPVAPAQLGKMGIYGGYIGVAGLQQGQGSVYLRMEKPNQTPHVVVVSKPLVKGISQIINVIGI